MAQVTNRPVLSLCIPIYNRISYLEKQFERFLEDKELFDNQVQLIISDNCSEDDLASCCKRYNDKGLKIQYHRNDTNIGPDRNFEWCFYNADGEYVWLLGSDDIPVSGLLKKIVHYLQEGDYGLFHLGKKRMKNEITIYNHSDDMAVGVGYWITFMSINIIRTETVHSIDLSEYRNSFMIQVPAYLNACCKNNKNAIFYQPQIFEKGTDNANNGGYNFFQVFVTNLYGIYESFVNKQLLSHKAFNKMIRIEYRDYLSSVIIHNLILHEKRGFSVEDGWKHLCKYYVFKPYAYYYLIVEPIRRRFGRNS